MASQHLLGTADNLPRQQGFSRYTDLPYEVRIIIIEFAIQNSMSTVRTLAVTSPDADEDGLPHPPELSIITQSTAAEACPLCYISIDFHTEITRLCRLLPHRRILRTGANTFSVEHGQGQLPLLLSERAQQRYVHPYATVFFLDEANAARVFMYLNTHPIPDRSPLQWITRIMLAGRTFVHLLLFYRRNAPPQGLPFTLLPALRTIRVGFLQRFRDVVHIEGPLAEVATNFEEIDVTDRVDSEMGLLGTVDSVPLFLLYETVQPTVEDMNVLIGRGIQVIWCAVGDNGVGRRIDIEDDAGIER